MAEQHKTAQDVAMAQRDADRAQWRRYAEAVSGVVASRVAAIYGPSDDALSLITEGVCEPRKLSEQELAEGGEGSHD